MLWKIQFNAEGLSLKERNILCFAAQELKKYLKKATSDDVMLSESARIDGQGILLRLAQRGELPTLEDAALDDAILIDVENRCGVIAGSNARSVLIGVYRYLREMGFVFVRPGKNGERYPERLSEGRVSVCERASYRHRGICIEGSVFYESEEDLIDWLPKVGMNSYYVQFFVPAIFFRRWYEHEGYGIRNPYLERMEISDEDVAGMNRMIVHEMEKRGILHHAVGHGWTCHPFGLPSTGWYEIDPAEVPKGVDKYFALQNGERKLYGNCPINTSLCYGSTEVRNKMTDSMVKYCLENPDVDYLHVWLADGVNNHCECELCRDHRPSDLYVKMLNELDEKLTAKNIHKKIVFLMYVDLLWAPREEKIKNKDRFMLIFCPIARSYSTPLSENAGIEPAEYVRNRLTFPSCAGEYIGFLKEWKNAFDGESCVFDYYYMWDCYKDLGYTDNAKLIHQDIRDYREFDFNGLISCQGNRTFLPTSLGMNVMAETLWNRDCDFEAIREKVLKAEYGACWKEVCDYLALLSECSLPRVTRFEVPITAPENRVLYEKGICASEEILKLAEKNSDADSWKQLWIYVQLVSRIMKAFLSFAKGEAVAGTWREIEDFINLHEWEMRETYDAFEFKYTLSRVFERLEREAGVE